MRAIILSAAKPTFTPDPVSHIKIEGLNLLDIQISCLKSAGIEDISVVTGYQADLVGHPYVQCYENTNWANTGSLTSLSVVTELLNDDSEDVLLVYGDTLFEPSLVKSLADTNTGISVLCFLDRSNQDLELYREFAEIQDGLLGYIGEPRESNGVRCVFTGLTMISKHRTRLFNDYMLRIQPDEPKSHIGRLLQTMISNGVEIRPILTEHGWAELSGATGYQATLENRDLLRSVVQLHTDWSDRAKAYDKLDWVNNDALLAAVTKIANEISPRTVMDVGTGSGKVLLAIRDTLGEGEFWGVDSSQAMLDKIPDAENLVLKISDAETLDNIPDDKFDLVTARMVFHHINDIPKAVDSIHRVLNNNGYFVICEGVPPTIRTIEWYTEMFRYKEDRNTLTEVDLINMLVRGGFEDIQTRTVVMRNASLNNWLDNSGIPQANIDKIKAMHFEAPRHVQEDYDMQFKNDDCLMTWKFTFAIGKTFKTRKSM